MTVIDRTCQMFIDPGLDRIGTEQPLSPDPLLRQQIEHHGFQIITDPVFNGNTESLFVAMLYLTRQRVPECFLQQIFGLLFLMARDLF